MFFYEKIPFETIFVAILIVLALVLLNEITRRSKILSCIVYIALPIILTIFVWPKTAGKKSIFGYWFVWVKTYSALAGVIGFMFLRYIKDFKYKKYFMLFPPIILALNILEAVLREFQVFNKNYAFEEGLLLIGGSWNILNAIAGIVLVFTITGWYGVKIAKTKSKDMVWADQLWFWIIAYTFWNMAYVYNCIPNRSFYDGFLVLIASLIPAFFIKKGAWLQHRAQTLIIWILFVMSIPQIASTSKYAVDSTHKTSALFVLSLLSLILNVAVLVYEIYKVRKTKRNPITSNLYKDLKCYKKNLQCNNLIDKK